VTPAAGEERALGALTAYGIPYAVTRHGRVGSLAEAAALRGVEPGDIIKTLVVRRGEGDHLFVLVPVNRMTMPGADEAREVTGYERGTITPFGSLRALPVIADASVAGRTISMGAGAHGVAVTVSGDEVIRALGATVADISDVSPTA
jgi:prolyl-tRNA editing enzyme YbaK/EbsC (Cys-tRNA(Pro) deacylase)